MRLFFAILSIVELSIADSAFQSCAFNPNRRCPPPSWKPVWDLASSTFAQPCNKSGYFNASLAVKYGLVSFDWSNAKELWMAYPRDQAKCEEMLVEQAKMVKLLNPDTRVLVYRNLELSLEWLSSERLVMYDSDKMDWWLRFKNGSIYQTDIKAGDQFFWNYTNRDAVDYFIEQVALGPNGLGSEWVDGIYTDDVDGTFQEHKIAIEDLELTSEEVISIENATNHMYDELISRLVQAGGYNYQAFHSGDGAEVILQQPGATCTKWMRQWCAETEDIPMLIELPMSNLTNSTIAGFLIARGPHWWIGSGWQGCTAPIRPELVDVLDVGVPVSGCREHSEGYFERVFDKGYVTLDCSDLSSLLHFPAKNV